MRLTLVRMILVFAALGSGCAGFEQAYHERVCWRNGLPSECPDYAITLNCPDVPVANPRERTISGKKVFVQLVDGPANPKVGDLFSQRGDKPIFLKGDSAWETLQRDLKTILRSFGLQIQKDKNTSEFVIEGNVTLLDVRTTPGGLLNFEVPTKAKASFEVKLIDLAGELLWHQEFHGSDELMASYAYLTDSQKLLGHAYCRALQQFSVAFGSVALSR